MNKTSINHAYHWLNSRSTPSAKTLVTRWWMELRQKMQNFFRSPSVAICLNKVDLNDRWDENNFECTIFASQLGPIWFWLRADETLCPHEPSRPALGLAKVHLIWLLNRNAMQSVSIRRQVRRQSFKQETAICLVGKCKSNAISGFK